MPMTDAEYDAKRARIIKDWADFPGMAAVLLAELDAYRAGRSNAVADAASTGPTQAEVRALARQYAATMPYVAALNRAEQVLAEEAGATRVISEADMNSMSVPELQAYLRTFDRRLLAADLSGTPVRDYIEGLLAGHSG